MSVQASAWLGLTNGVGDGGEGAGWILKSLRTKLGHEVLLASANDNLRDHDGGGRNMVRVEQLLSGARIPQLGRLRAVLLLDLVIDVRDVHDKLNVVTKIFTQNTAKDIKADV